MSDSVRSQMVSRDYRGIPASTLLSMQQDADLGALHHRNRASIAAHQVDARIHLSAAAHNLRRLADVTQALSRLPKGQ